MKIIAKAYSISQFDNYVDGLKFNGWTPNFTAVHNTSVPTQKLYREWHSRKGWTVEQWLRNLASYYAGKGWKGTPHVFVTYDYICVLNDLTVPGRHSPSWNNFSWGVEATAEFDSEEFQDGIRENLIAALGILHSRIGLNPADFKLGVRGLHFHKEDKATTHKRCPGKNLVKKELVAAVLDYMNRDGSDHIHVTEKAQTANTTNLTIHELTSIRWVQERLNAKGYDLFVDGNIGPKTKAAVKAFQKANKLKVDGIPGPVTRLALKA